MIRFPIASLWAAAILGAALASRSGAIPNEAGETLILLLPALAAVTLARSRRALHKGVPA